jgi:hypothetical protein
MAQFLANILDAIAKGDASKMIGGLREMHMRVFCGSYIDVCPDNVRATGDASLRDFVAEHLRSGEDLLIRWFIVPATFYAPNAQPLTELIWFYGSRILSVCNIRKHLGAAIGRWTIQEIASIIGSASDSIQDQMEEILKDMYAADELARHPRNEHPDSHFGLNVGPITAHTMARIGTDAEICAAFKCMRDMRCDAPDLTEEVDPLVEVHQNQRIKMQARFAYEMGRRCIGLAFLCNDCAENRVGSDLAAPVNTRVIIAAINGAANWVEPSAWYASEVVRFVDVIANASHAELLRALGEPKFRAHVEMKSRIAKIMWMPLLLASATRDVIASELQIPIPGGHNFHLTGKTRFFGVAIPTRVMKDTLEIMSQDAHGAKSFLIVVRDMDARV